MFNMRDSFAAEQAVAETETKVETETETETETASELIADQTTQESKEARPNLKYQLAVAILGREYIGNGVTVSAGHFLSPNDLVTLRYTTYNGSNDKALQKLRALTAGYRHFWGNSFNVMPTVYYRRNTADYFKEDHVTVTGSSNLIYEDIGLGIRLGNEFQWKNITLGCDWLGVNHTLKKLNHEERAQGTIDSLKLQKNLTITLLSFYLGYAF